MRRPLADWPGLPRDRHPPPRALDLGRRRRDLEVTVLDAQDRFAAVARHQGAFRAVRLRDASARTVLLVAVRTGDTGHERTGRDFADDCQAAGVAEPAELWEQDALPRWLRRLLSSA